MPPADPLAAPPPHRRAKPAPVARECGRSAGRHRRTEPRQSPQPAQRRPVRLVATAALGAGATVVLVASSTGSLAASPPRSAAPQTTAAAAAAAAAGRVPAAPSIAAVAAVAASSPSSVPASATRKHARPAGKAARKRTPAPATKAVISGLAADGIPATALNAYRVAAARMASADPSCGIQWSLVAGIGRVESNHGRFGGAVLRTDGTSTPRVIGPALNGNGTELISAPAGGAAQSGDAVYTHALGPMQFIPQTWATYGTSANDRGPADIFNINDAALSAARYLCAAGGDLRTAAGRTRAVFSYNHSDTYVAEVLALAEAYRTGMTVTGVPIGEVTGSLPPVTGSVVPPPVNPGAPTAVSGRHKKHEKRHKHTRTPRTTPGSAPSTAPRSSPPPRRPSSSAPAAGAGSPTGTGTSSTPDNPSRSGTPSPSPSDTGTADLATPTAS